ncbi:MAG: DUF2062 domain-containing protein [Chloroflexi bacterium]|nr:MAG: DUF2062 domain-containing protein [Chloroflexota bacterium]
MSNKVKRVRFWSRIKTRSGAWLRQKWQVLADADTSPQQVALAFAVGTFISILPTPGVNTLLAVLAAFLFRLHKGALLASLAVWNVVVVAPFYALSHLIGQAIWRMVHVSAQATAVPNPTTTLAIGFLLGNFIIAVFLTSTSYAIVRSSVAAYRQKSNIN